MCRISSSQDFAFVIFYVSPAGNKKLSGGERGGYNLFYSVPGRNSAVDGWTPIYPHLGVINVNGLASARHADRTMVACHSGSSFSQF